MAAASALTNFTCYADPDNPGWLRWSISDRTRFNGAVLDPLMVRQEGPASCRVRMIPRAPLHTNSADMVHGGVTLSFIDVSLFATSWVLKGIDAGRSVTLDLSTQFIGSGDVSRPLDCVVEMLRETGRLAFLRGLVMQDDVTIASFGATLRKPSSR